jgi:hypothetical protein
MAENVTLKFLGAQMERMFVEQAKTREEIAALREDMHVLTSIALPHENMLKDVLERITAMGRQHARFSERLRRLEEHPAR